MLKNIIIWSLEKKYQSRSHIITIFQEFQLDFKLNVLFSLTSIKGLGFFQPMHLVFTYPMHLILHRFCHLIDKVLIYEINEYFTMVSICIAYFFRYKIIIFPCEVVSFIISICQNINISQSTGSMAEILASFVRRLNLMYVYVQNGAGIIEDLTKDCLRP